MTSVAWWPSRKRAGHAFSVVSIWWALLLGSIMVYGCDDSAGLVARVNHAPIPVAELNLLLNNRGLSLETASAEQRVRAEEELIDQALFVQQARKLYLDQTPEYEQATKAWLARAYLERRAADLGDPGEEAVKAFFEARPELFGDRRRYQLQEIAIQAEGPRLVEAEQAFETIRSFNDLVARLKIQNIPYKVAATFKSADEIPSDLLAHLRNASEGQALKVRIPGGFAALQVVRIIPDPVSLEDAQEDIRRYLRNRRIEGMLKDLSLDLRKVAKIERYAAGVSGPNR